VITFEVSSASPAQVDTDLLVLPCYEGPTQGPGVTEVGTALGVNLVEILRRHRFSARVGDTLDLVSVGHIPAGSLVFVGLGPAGEVDPDVIRRAAMRAAGCMAMSARAATTLPAAGILRGEAGTGEEAASAFAEGLLLGAYRFDRYKRDPIDLVSREKPVLERVTVLAGAAERARVASGLRHGEVFARAANWARDLVNAPAADATPAALADEAAQVARECGMACKVWAAGDLARGGFGGILGVGQGSINEPRLLELSYSCAGGARPICLTGKGITFDSGGLSLKRSSEMEWMKSDMAGAAAVLAAMRGAVELDLRVNVDAVLPFAENLPGGSALRPGDVVTQRGGRTSEVADTDSEGRLILADALAYLAERRPAAVVDVATLTDAAGLGEALWAVMGNDPGLIAELLAAGEDVGDRGWQLPLPAAYRHYLESSVADIRNTPEGAPDTTVMAGLYLREFIADIPWVHIDNGSTAYLLQGGDGWPKGATGSPTRAMLRWLERRAEHRR